MMMKKNKLLILSLVAVCCMSLVSCGSNSDDEDPVKPTEPTTPTTEEAMAPAKQKEYLETVAKELMNDMPSSDFKNIADLGTYVDETYGDDYNWDGVSDWAHDAFDGAREALGTKTTEKVHDGYYAFNYIFTNYKAVLLASNFTGHFTAKNGKWTRTNADDLQFIFKDKTGQECIVRLQTSGSVKKVYAANIDEYQYYGYDDGVSNEYFDRTQLTIGVPEKIVATLTQGGKQVVHTTVNVDLGSITGERFDISSNSLTLSTVTQLNNGYKIDLSQVAYRANQKASVNFNISKNGTSLLTVAFASDINDIPSCNVDAFSATNFDIDKYNTDYANAKNAFVKVDVLGKVQVQGMMANLRQFANYIDAAEDNEKSEDSFKSYVNLANNLTDINLFYNGNSVKQATVKIEAFHHDAGGYWGEAYWYAEPVIHFFDGSSYTTFDVFFNEVDFKNTFDDFNSLVDRYQQLFDW